MRSGWRTCALFCAALCAGVAQVTAAAEGVEVDVRAALPSAGQASLVWGINGWGVLPEASRPPGTTVVDRVMHTRLSRQHGVLTARLLVPAGATVEYGLLVTHRANGTAIVPVWLEWSTGQPAIAEPGSVLAWEETPAIAARIARAPRLPGLRRVLAVLIAGIALIAALGWGLRQLPSPPPARTIWLVLGLMTMAGLAVRLWSVGASDRLWLVPAVLVGDEGRYDSVALSLNNGEFFPWPVSAPLYPLFLAACYALFGHAYPPVLIAQAVMGALAVPLTYALARRFTGPRSAMFAALLIALHPGLAAHPSMLYMEALYVPLVIAALLGLQRLIDQPGSRRALVAGIWLALITLCRPATALFPVVLPLVMRGRRWTQRIALAAALLAVVAAAAAPWAYNSWRRHGVILPFGISLTMLWHGSPEFYHIMQRTPNAMLRVWDTELNPAKNGGHNPSTIEGDRYFNARAVASIRAEPAVYARYSLQKLAYFWLGHPAARYDWPFDFAWLRRAYSTREIAGLFFARVAFVAAAFLALLVLWRRLREFSLLLLFCGYVMGVHTVLTPVARYSEPLYPVLAVLIAAAASQVLRRRQAAGARA